MKKIIGKYAHLIALLLVQYFAINNIYAQKKFSDGLKIQTNYHQGLIFPEYGLLAPIDEDFRRSIELNVSKQTRGKSSWEKLYNYPENGLSFFYTSLGHDKVLGRKIGVNYFFKINFLNKKRFRIFNQTGFGFNYITRKFDEIENPLNVSMGSHYNFHFNFRLGATYYFSEKSGFNLGVSFDHISNANLDYPNLGINSRSLFVGITHDIGNKIEKNVFEIEPHQRKTNIEILTSIGWWHLNIPGDKYYFTPSMIIEITNETFRFFHFGGGADLFYDESVKVKFQVEGKQYQNIYSFQSGIHLSQTIVYDRFKFVIQEGLYSFIAEELDRELMYNRIIFKYSIKPKISIHLLFKTHLQDLKYTSIGVGFRI